MAPKRPTTTATPPPPSSWVCRAMEQICGPADRAPVLDLACGSGRHSRVLLRRGHRVLAVDRDISQISAIASHGRLRPLRWDLEDGTAWPFAEARFKAVVVANYLHRPTLDRTLRLIRPGGVLIYETFGVGNESYRGPSNPDFLAAPGEIAACARALGLIVLADSHRRVERPFPAIRQRVLARASRASK